MGVDASLVDNVETIELRFEKLVFYSPSVKMTLDT